ncbi:MAG: hypothetical protein AAF533_14360 [Acidobacteriota bacterium]
MVDDHCARRPDSALARLLPRSRQRTTVTSSRLRLNPWRTWPTLHRGVSEETHGLEQLGQDTSEADARHPPVWQLTRAAGLTTGVWGSLHSWPPPPSSETVPFHVPDVFAPSAEAEPSSLVPFQDLVLRMARRSARNVDRRVAGRETLRFLASAPFQGLRLGTMTGLTGQLLAERRQSWKRTRRRSWHPRLGFDLFHEQLRRHRPRFATFHTNHVAAAMHRYWAAAFPDDFDRCGYSAEWQRRYAGEITDAMDHLDVMLDQLFRSSERDGTVVVITGSMGQAAASPDPIRTQLYLTDVDRFAARLGLSSDDWSLRPAMAPRVSLSVVGHHVSDLLARLNTLRIAGTPVEVESPGESFVNLCFGQRDLDPATEQATLDGKPVPFAELGLENVKVEDESGQSGDHVAEGIFIVVDPAAEPCADRDELQLTEIAPWILDRLGVERPAHLLRAVGAQAGG